MPESRTLMHPRDEIMQTMSRIYGYRMTTTSGGRASAHFGVVTKIGGLALSDFV